MYRILGLCLTLLLTGCASLLGDNHRDIHVNSTPSGASVYVNNVYAGKTPLSVSLDDVWTTNLIQVEIPGAAPNMTVIKGEFQAVGLLNILFPPGFIIDAMTGDMKKIPADKKNLNINFPKQPEQPAISN